MPNEQCVAYPSHQPSSCIYPTGSFYGQSACCFDQTQTQDIVYSENIFDFNALTKTSKKVKVRDLHSAILLGKISKLAFETLTVDFERKLSKFFLQISQNWHILIPYFQQSTTTSLLPQSVSAVPCSWMHFVPPNVIHYTDGNNNLYAFGETLLLSEQCGQVNRVNSYTDPYTQQQHIEEYALSIQG